MATADISVAEMVAEASSRNLSVANFLPQQAMMEKLAPVRELLNYVFTANAKAVEEWFSRPILDPEMILEKTSYKEGYYSEKLKKFICVRHWRKVSPLQAAALCGDNFLVRKLLIELLQPKDEKLQQEAHAQLQEVWSRGRKQKPEGGDLDKGVFEEYDRDDNLDEEIKIAAEVVKYADEDTYLASYRMLHRAYHQYICKYGDIDNYAQGRWLTMAELQQAPELIQCWEKVGDLQKELPIYAFQEFCASLEDKCFSFCYPFHPSDIEPRRTYGLLTGKPINLDRIGTGTQHALHKGLDEEGVKEVLAADMNETGSDSGGFCWLAKVRGQELEQMIACLDKPDATEALTLFDDYGYRRSLDEARNRQWYVGRKQINPTF